MSKTFLTDARCVAQWEFAKSLDKPFFLLVEEGVVVPDEWREGVNIVEEIGFNRANLVDKLEEIKNKINKHLGKELKDV